MVVSIFICSGGSQYGKNIQAHTFEQRPVYGVGDSGYLFHFEGFDRSSAGAFD